MFVGARGSLNVYGCHSLSYRNHTDEKYIRDKEGAELSGLIRADESVTSYFDALKCERSWQSWNMQNWRRCELYHNRKKKKKHPLLSFSEWFHGGHKCLLWSSVNLPGPWWTGPGDKHKANLSHIKRRTPGVSMTSKPRPPQSTLEGWGACMYFNGPFCVCNTILCG